MYVVCMNLRRHACVCAWMCVCLCACVRVQIDGQTERKTERQKDRKTERNSDRQMYRQRDRQTDKRTDRQTDRQTARQPDNQTARQTDRRQTDRRTNRDYSTHTDGQKDSRKTAKQPKKKNQNNQDRQDLTDTAQHAAGPIDGTRRAARRHPRAPPPQTCGSTPAPITVSTRTHYTVHSTQYYAQKKYTVIAQYTVQSAVHMRSLQAAWSTGCIRSQKQAKRKKEGKKTKNKTQRPRRVPCHHLPLPGLLVAALEHHAAQHGHRHSPVRVGAPSDPNRHVHACGGLLRKKKADSAIAFVFDRIRVCFPPICVCF
jgi:hypothetical protein